MKNLILVIFVFIIVFVGCQPKSTPRQRGSGRTAGQIKPKTKEQIAEEKRQVQLAERKRQKELRREMLRRKREERRAQQLAGRYGERWAGRYGDYSSRTRRGRRASYGSSSRQRKTSGLYQITAIFTIEGKKYALIDARYVTAGDDIMGRKVIDILDDRIIINEYGRTREVRIGESILSSPITPQRRTR